MNKTIFVFLFWIITYPGYAQTNYSKLIHRYATAYASAYDFHGAILIAKRNTIIYQKAFGLANRELNVKNSLSTRFPIASLTKQFTSAAILQLAQQGKLLVDDKLNKFFPNFPKGDSVTLHMLMNHTSGIKEYSQFPEIFKPFRDINISKNKDTIIQLFSKLPFDFPPGTFWRYSNTNYILLGYIIEQVSGQPYGDYVNKNIFQKAGMSNSGLFSQDSIIPNRAYGYTQTPKGLIAQMIIPYNLGYSDGGLMSTAGDLFEWNKALASYKIISREFLDKMNRPNREDRGAGYGIFVDRFFDKKVYFHAGNIPGYSSMMINYPDDELNIIILANRETNLDFLPKGLAAILFDKEVVLPTVHKPIELSTEEIKLFTASFETPFPFKVVEREGKLFMSFGRDVELKPASKTKLFVSEPDVAIQLEYVFNKKMEIGRVYFIEGGLKTEAKLK